MTVEEMVYVLSSSTDLLKKMTDIIGATRNGVCVSQPATAQEFNCDLSLSSSLLDGGKTLAEHEAASVRDIDRLFVKPIFAPLEEVSSTHQPIHQNLQKRANEEISILESLGQSTLEDVAAAAKSPEEPQSEVPVWEEVGRVCAYIKNVLTEVGRLQLEDPNTTHLFKMIRERQRRELQRQLISQNAETSAVKASFNFYLDFVNQNYADPNENLVDILVGTTYTQISVQSINSLILHTPVVGDLIEPRIKARSRVEKTAKATQDIELAKLNQDEGVKSVKNFLVSPYTIDLAVQKQNEMEFQLFGTQDDPELVLRKKVLEQQEGVDSVRIIDNEEAFA
mmetsp:Transcript_8537/g.13178  ORF Transcript_8537/g.13178 Transcript_8537/m.13178 type:complete len:338 (-) Transcript_8537:8-1021(-)